MNQCEHEECQRSGYCPNSSPLYIVDAEGKVSLAPANAAKQPFRCPVCYGTGQVPSGYYQPTEWPWTATNIYPETCRGCSGSGVVWSP